MYAQDVEYVAHLILLVTCFRDNRMQLDFYEFATNLGTMIRGSEDQKLELSFRMLCKRKARPEASSAPVPPHALAQTATSGPRPLPPQRKFLEPGPIVGADADNSAASASASSSATAAAASSSGVGGLTGGAPLNGGPTVVALPLAGDETDVITLEEFMSLVRAMSNTINSLIGKYEKGRSGRIDGLGRLFFSFFT